MGSSSCEGLREKLKTMAVHRQRGGSGLSVEPCGCRRIHSVLRGRGQLMYRLFSDVPLFLLRLKML